MRRRSVLALLAAATFTAVLPGAEAGEGAHDAINFALSEFRTVEGSAAAIVVQRAQHGSGPATVDLRTIAGTALEGADFTALDETLTLAPEDSRDVYIPTTEDVTEEPVESFTVKLSNPSSSANLGYPNEARVIITDDDGPSRVSFGAPSFAAFENTLQARVTLVRSGDAGSAASISYSTADGSAIAGRDYKEVTQTVDFEAGQRYKWFYVTLLNDSVAESQKSFNLTLEAVSGTGLEAPSTVAVYINDDDTATAPPSDTKAPFTGFHEPLDGRTYRQSYLGYLLVFYQDNTDGSGVEKVQAGLRKKFRDGTCAWWNGTGFRQRPCTKRLWVTRPANRGDEVALFELAKPLKPSIGTDIRRYTAYSRAIDFAGNVSLANDVGQNQNRFEIKR